MLLTVVLPNQKSLDNAIKQEEFVQKYKKMPYLYYTNTDYREVLEILTLSLMFGFTENQPFFQKFGVL